MAKPKCKTTDAGFQAVNEVADAKAARKRRQAFYTPIALVEKLVEWADVSPSLRCLEPSAGDGRIVHALKTAGVEAVDACETETAMVANIEAAGGAVVGADFLHYQPGAVYDRIVMNPPFKGKTAEKHIEHAWSLLRTGGVLLSVAPTSAASRIQRNELKLPACEHASYENVGGDWFKEFGTGIEVIVVELRRGPYAPVEGYRNAATLNAALTIQTDRKMSEACHAARGVTPAVKAQALKEIAGVGGSCYGIAWEEVDDEYAIPF